MTIKSGAQLIADERQRQLTEEGYTAQRDDAYKPGTLTMAGITYATCAASSPVIRSEFRKRVDNGAPVLHWPWDIEHLKLNKDDCYSSRIQELAKAGALIAAEIDYLQRKSS